MSCDLKFFNIISLPFSKEASENITGGTEVDHFIALLKIVQLSGRCVCVCLFASVYVCVLNIM